MSLEPDRPEPASSRAPPAGERSPTLTLEARLAATPLHAQLRGVFFQLVARAAADVAAPPSATPSTAPPRRAYGLYPVRDFLVFLDAAGRRLGPTPALGMQRCLAHAVEHLQRSGSGRAFRQGREPLDPLSLLQRLERSRALLANYGRWRVTGVDRDVTIDVSDEWVWIGEAWVPAISSIFTACDLRGARVDCEPHGPFAARLRVRW